MLIVGSRSRSARLVLALVCFVGAVALLYPAPPVAAGITWERLIAPLGVGRPVAAGYLLGPPHRGQEHDVVFTARAAAGDSQVEVHVLDRGRWPGVRESASFGIGYEIPRSPASEQDRAAVTEAVAQAIRANDTGELPTVDAIPLRGEPPPPLVARILDRVAGGRGLLIGACVVGLTWILASMRRGALVVSIVLGLIGLALRAPSAGIPFVRDQDVQRLFTGHLPLLEILLGKGLEDRHPPLYFAVLHLTELFGQSEAVARAPALVGGALVGPAIVWGAVSLGRRVELAALAGLGATVSVELVLRSREVSPIPLFALLAIALCVSLVRHRATPSRPWTAALIGSLALALWTYYLAPFVILGALAALAALGQLSRRTLRAVAAGLLAGAPALALGGLTFVRDRAARLAAAQHPELAWGERGLADTIAELGALSVSALGTVMVVLLVVVAILATRQRDASVLVPLGALLSSFAAIALLAPVARVQPYYLVAVLPLGLLALGLGNAALDPSSRWLEPAVVSIVVAVTGFGALGTARTLYLPPAEAFMPAFAALAAARPEQRILTVAHYDGTLLAYYLARRANVPVDWELLQREPEGDAFLVVGTGKVVGGLAQSHSLGADPGAAALAKLEAELARGPVLVVERAEFHLPRVRERLERCERLAEIGRGRLYRCAIAN